jgi:hypothetical protein
MEPPPFAMMRGGAGRRISRTRSTPRSTTAAGERERGLSFPWAGTAGRRARARSAGTHLDSRRFIAFLFWGHPPPVAVAGAVSLFREWLKAEPEARRRYIW